MKLAPTVGSKSGGGYGLCPSSISFACGIDLVVEVRGQRVVGEPDREHGREGQRGQHRETARASPPAGARRRRPRGCPMRTGRGSPVRPTPSGGVLSRVPAGPPFDAGKDAPTNGPSDLRGRHSRSTIPFLDCSVAPARKRLRPVPSGSSQGTSALGSGTWQESVVMLAGVNADVSSEPMLRSRIKRASPVGVPTARASRQRVDRASWSARSVA